MKVMCIQSPDELKVVAAIFDGNIPEVGDECVVKSTHRCSCGTHDVYDLEGYWLPTLFPTELFAILNESNADELQDVEREAIVPEPPFPLFQ
jgi:hypothetical protein